MVGYIPSYYSSDDLLIQELHNQAQAICNAPVTKTSCCASVSNLNQLTEDTFDPSEKADKKSKIKKGLVIAGVLVSLIAGGILLKKCGSKLWNKIKSIKSNQQQTQTSQSNQQNQSFFSRLWNKIKSIKLNKSNGTSQNP